MNVRFVLVRCRNSLNIGAAARAMANFGLVDLAAVEPYDFNWEQAKRATAGADQALKSAQKFDTLPQALADRTLVFGTTDGRRRITQPLVPLDGLQEFMRKRRGAAAKIAVLFGSEKTGLRNEDLQHCHALLRIPTRAEAPSMNLGQAVAVIAYELARAGFQDAARPSPFEPPSVAHLNDLVQRADAAIETLGYKTAIPKRTREEKLRRMFLRWQITKGDAAFLQAIFRRVAKA